MLTPTSATSRLFRRAFFHCLRPTAFFVFQLLTLPVFAQSPGGVSTNLDVWLKADAGVYIDAGTTLATNGQTVQQWNTQAGTNHFVQTGSNKPTFRTGRINANPTLEFTGNTFISAGANVGVTANGSFNMFLVFKQNSYILGGTNDGSGSFIVDRVVENNNLMSFKMVTSSRYNYQKRSDGGANLGGPVSSAAAPTGIFTLIDYYRVYNSQFGIYIDGRLDATDNTGVGDAITGNRVQLGRHAVGANQGLNGEIAEVILYRGAVSAAERGRIDSYLALKYGITLDPTASPNQDYYNSAGTVVFPASTAAFQPYRYDVAGIITDTGGSGSGLTQTTSRSQNTNYIVTVSNPSAMVSGESLVWGSNNGSLTAGNESDIGAPIQRRLARVWRIRETGNVGTVTISFDLSAVPGAKSQTDLRLLIDRNGNGFADNDVTPLSGTLSGGNLITFTAVNFNNNDFFTIGTTNKTGTPLPVELISFDATYSHPVVNLQWRTASELNNSHFIIERSLDGTTYSRLGRVEGQGTTITPQTYGFSDEIPMEGRSYYRLTQVDFDGQQAYSPVATVFIAPTAQTLSVWPNPVKDGRITIHSRDRDLNVTGVVLVDLQGRILDKQQPDAESRNTVIYQVPSSLAAGSYLLRISANGLAETHRVQVTR